MYEMLVSTDFQTRQIFELQVGIGPATVRSAVLCCGLTTLHHTTPHYTTLSVVVGLQTG